MLRRGVHWAAIPRPAPAASDSERPVLTAVAERPRILVLLATHNGADYLAEQLDSVLGQQDVEVRVVVSDDASSDATMQVLGGYAADERVEVLEPGRFGSAAANFFRLVRHCDATGFNAVAFCDQDDIWVPHKLRRHYELLELAHGLDGAGPYAAVSSNVTAFDAVGNRRLIVKNQQQRACDYAFESGGPGSTFLLRPEAYVLVRDRLRRPDSAASAAKDHDWLIYALVRASGGRWCIDSEATVDYRQHDANALGANEGWRQNLRRFRQIADRTHRRDTQRIVAAAQEVATPQQAPRLEWLAARITRNDVFSRLRLARRAPELRRRRRDQLALAATVALGIW